MVVKPSSPKKEKKCSNSNMLNRQRKEAIGKANEICVDRSRNGLRVKYHHGCKAMKSKRGKKCSNTNMLNGQRNDAIGKRKEICIARSRNGLGVKYHHGSKTMRSKRGKKCCAWTLTVQKKQQCEGIIDNG